MARSWLGSSTPRNASTASGESQTTRNLPASSISPEPLLNQVIRPQQQRLRNREAERRRRLSVDHELEGGGQLDGKLRRLRSFRVLVDISGGPPVVVAWIGSIGD